MNDTENYLSHVKSTLHVRLAVSFAVNLSVAAVAFLVSYLIFGAIEAGSYVVACDVSGSGFPNTLRSAVRSQMPCSVLMLMMYVSAYSSLNGAVSLLLCAWRGLCLGSTVSLISGSYVGGVGSGWKISLLLYLGATIVIIAFASVSSLYSSAITYTFSSGDRRYYKSLAAEYTKSFLIASGVIFSLGCASAVFI